MGLELQDYPQPGARLLLTLEQTNAILHLRVLHASKKSSHETPIFLVELDHGNSSSVCLHLPETFILKVYDPKFRRNPDYPDYPDINTPWSLDTEMKAAAKRKESGQDENPNFEESGLPSSLLGWEEWYYQHALRAYRDESSAYNRLKVFQDSTLLKYYGSGILHLPQRAITPHAILLEYIPDMKRLDEVDPKAVSAHLIDSLLETTKQFGRMGVVHTDIGALNVFFSPGDQPVRAMIINFEEASIRGDECDEEWQERVDSDKNLFWVQRCLKRYLGDVMQT